LAAIMEGDSTPHDLAREDAHPKAQEALTDAFFWDGNDLGAPLGGDTGRDVLEALRDAREADPRGNILVVLDEILAGWEVANLATVAHAVLTAATERQESRGAHTRLDFPDLDGALHCRLVLKGIDRG